ncbi:MAG: CBS domain-containing protein [Nocardioidaceae bacterium]
MRARDIAEDYPTIALDDDALVAAQTMAAARRPGLIVLGEDGRPYTILPGSQVLKFIIPSYVQDQPALARAYGEKASDELCATLVHHTVRDLLPKPADVDELPIVDPDATMIEVAAVMAQVHSPLVAVVDENEGMLGAITASVLLTRIIPA